MPGAVEGGDQGTGEGAGFDVCQTLKAFQRRMVSQAPIITQILLIAQLVERGLVRRTEFARSKVSSL